MNTVQVMDIGEVSKRSGLPASTLRYYEEIGLITSIGRRGLRRIFDANILLLLNLISLGRDAGFSLSEIAGMFTPAGPRIDRELLSRRADELDRSISKLTAMRDGLRHAAKCPAPNHLECPTFQRLVKLSGRKRVRIRNDSRKRKSS